MYLTGGQFKGRKILVPKNTKPTLSKVRQGVFNMLNQFDIEEKTFLDMFAGSGLMGLEALSRGYTVKELELNSKSAEIIKENYKNISINPDITVCNSLKYNTDKKYSIIYLDPPWELDYLPVIKKACELAHDNSLIVIEHDYNIKNQNIDDIINSLSYNLEKIKSKKYGRCLIDIVKVKMI